MESKLKKRLFRNHTLPVVRDSGKSYGRITGMTSGNIAGVSAASIAYEQSRAYLANIAEIEIKRAQASAEAHRLSLR
jgi:hypothetical protein